MDNELNELKNKRMEQLKQAYANQFQRQASENADAAQQVAALEEAVKPHLSREALQRYGTLKLAHPETAVRLALAIARLIETGRINGLLSEEQAVSILKQISQMQPQKEMKIIRK